MHAAFDIAPLVAERRSVLFALIATNAILTVIFAAAAWLTVTRMLRPVRVLTAHLQAAAEHRGELIPARIVAQAPGEFRPLFQSFNDMAEAVREREALAKQLADEERLASLGRLASGMAHEINNPLGGLFNAIDTLKEHGGRPEVRRRTIDLIERGLRGIRDVVRTTLVTYRTDGDADVLKATDIDDLKLLVEPEIRRKELTLGWTNADYDDVADLAVRRASDHPEPAPQRLPGRARRRRSLARRRHSRPAVRGCRRGQRSRSARRWTPNAPWLERPASNGLRAVSVFGWSAGSSTRSAASPPSRRESRQGRRSASPFRSSRRRSPMSLEGRTIALVEDDPIMGESLADRLSLEGARVLWWQSCEAAAANLETVMPDLVVCDIRLPDGSGEDVFRAACSVPDAAPFLFVTAFGEIDQAVRLMRERRRRLRDEAVRDGELPRPGRAVAAAEHARAGHAVLGVSPQMLGIEKMLRRIAAPVGASAAHRARPASARRSAPATCTGCAARSRGRSSP